MSDVANYQDPNPGLMGWGIHPQIAQNLAAERLIHDDLASRTKLICSADQAIGAAQISPKLEEQIRKLFKFDKGWSFLEVEKLVYGRNFNMNQNIGNCVGASHSMLLATRIAHEILGEGDAENPLGQGLLGMPFIPYSYGVGRMVGGMLSGGDGSFCGAQIEGTQKYGFLPCSTPGIPQEDLPQGLAQTGRRFGSSQQVLEKWMPHAKVFDLEEAPACRSADDAIKLITEKYYPLQICSGWGFGYWKYDANYDLDLYKPSGSWSHSMQIVACFEVKGAWFVTIRNQWGDSHKGSLNRGFPKNCMVIPIETFDRWVKDSETLAIGKIKGLSYKVEV